MLDNNYLLNRYPFIIEGIVKDTSDPQQMGRVKVWCPSIDGEYFRSLSSLPWADYASPFAGVVVDFKSGRSPEQTNGPRSYGFWAIPKIGSKVYVFLLNGEIDRRVYFAATFPTHLNRSLPRGRNIDPITGKKGPQTDDYNVINPATSNLKEQFKGDFDSSISQTRGVYERQVAQDRTEKNGNEGYGAATFGDGEEFKYLDPQVYCWTTPGGHSIILTDNRQHCRIRVVTTEGNQVLLDDTNERIYISTARGGTYIELDENGHIHIFGSDSISIRSGGDINILADKDVNIEAEENINLKAVGGDVKIGASSGIHLNAGGTIYESSCGNHNIRTEGNITITSSICNINGPTAEEAQSPDSPSIVPGHEPWSRPTQSKVKRNSLWKK